jgi:hypothetical protein
MAIATYILLWGADDAAAATALNIEGFGVTPRAVDGFNPGYMLNQHEVGNWIAGNPIQLSGMYLVLRSVIDGVGFASSNPALHAFLLTKPWGLVDDTVAFLVP